MSPSRDSPPEREATRCLREATLEDGDAGTLRRPPIRYALRWGLRYSGFGRERTVDWVTQMKDLYLQLRQDMGYEPARLEMVSIFRYNLDGPALEFFLQMEHKDQGSPMTVLKLLLFRFAQEDKFKDALICMLALANVTTDAVKGPRLPEMADLPPAEEMD